ncbi:uncharacterized protein [Dendropsophus ebraccatus]|uniref:uncharacterized protein isoform X1 n=2 Tax=Dendropsophus ebraccatus TaxID=150705 RepID=UPI0038319C45
MEKMKRKELRSEKTSPVEGYPCIWDLNDPKYSDRHKKHDVWSKIIRTLYPELDSYNAKMQKQICLDVRNRWRSIRDQYRKDENEVGKSGSSPAKRKCAYYEQLHFLHTGRELRPTDGNITASVFEVDDHALVSSGSAGDTGLSQEALPGMSHEASPQRKHISKRCDAAIRQSGQRPRSTPQCCHSNAMARETLSMIQRVDREDHWDQLASSIVARLRQLPESRQWRCVPALFEVMTMFANPHPIPKNNEIYFALSQVMLKKVSNPIPRTPSQLLCNSYTTSQQSCQRMSGESISHSIASNKPSQMSASSATRKTFLELLNSPTEQSSSITQITHASQMYQHTSTSDVGHSEAPYSSPIQF